MNRLILIIGIAFVFSSSSVASAHPVHVSLKSAIFPTGTTSATSNEFDQGNLRLGAPATATLKSTGGESERGDVEIKSAPLKKEEKKQFSFFSDWVNERREQRITDFAENMQGVLSNITDKLYTYSEKLDDRIILIEQKTGTTLTAAREQLGEASLALDDAHVSVDGITDRAEVSLETYESKDAFTMVQEDISQTRAKVETAHQELADVVAEVKDGLGLDGASVAEPLLKQ